MSECSNPVQCQMAKREECTCGCLGANHGILRKMMGDPGTQLQAEEMLSALKERVASEKKLKKVERRKKRAEARRSS